MTIKLTLSSIPLSATVGTASVTRKGDERLTQLRSKKEGMQSRKATTRFRWILNLIVFKKNYMIGPRTHLPANRSLWTQSEQGCCPSEEHRLYPGCPWILLDTLGVRNTHFLLLVPESAEEEAGVWLEHLEKRGEYLQWCPACEAGQCGHRWREASTLVLIARLAQSSTISSNS